MYGMRRVLLKGNLILKTNKKILLLKLLNEYLKTVCFNSFPKIQSEFALGVRVSI